MEDREKDAPVEETAVMNTSDDTSPDTDTGDGAAEAESERKKAPGAKTVAIAAAVALAIAAACGVAAMGASQAQQPASEQKEQAVEEETDASEDEAATVEVGIAETADAMDESTSPTIVHFKGASGDAEGVDFYHATPAKEAMAGNDSVELAEGSYEVEFLPTVNSDGSINKGTGDKPQDLDIDASDDMERVVAIDSETTAADKVTADQIAEVQKATAEAVAKGDETLTGDAGEKIAEKVAENASKAPAADKEKVEEAKQEAADAADKGSTAQTASKTDSKGSSSQKTDAGKTSTGPSATTVKKDTASTSKGSTSSKTEIKTDSNKGSSGSNSSSSQGGSTSKKECSHDWVAQTTTKWVQDSAAYDEQVCVTQAYDESVLVERGYAYFNYDGYKAYTQAETTAHGKQLTLAHVDSSYYTVDDTYRTVHHDAVYETVHHDATGHNETVATGYKCSKCGATK